MSSQPTQKIPRIPASGPRPLSPAQRRLWILDQLDREDISSNRPLAFRLAGLLDIQALETSLAEITRRHEILRSVFPGTDGEAVQVVSPVEPWHLSTIDLKSVPLPERDAEARRIALCEAQKKFDLAKGPLVRGVLLRLQATDHVLLLLMHHIVFDGWSESILMQELRDLYEAISNNRPPPQVDLPIQYSDFALWQQRRLDQGELEAPLRYWKNQLHGLSPLLLPTDYPRPQLLDSRGARHIFHVPLALTEALKELSLQRQATLFMTLLTAFQSLLSRYSGQNDLAVGVPVAGRTLRETEKLIGCFINMLVFRSAFSGDSSFIEALGKTRQVALDAYANQDIPFEKLVEELQPERLLNRWPLCQAMFNFRNMPAVPIGIAGTLRIERFTFDTGISAGLDLVLEATGTAEGLVCAFSYPRALYRAETIERMAGHFSVLLGGLVAAPEQRVAMLPILTAAERHQLLTQWNHTKRDYPLDQCIHELFEAQVQKTPDNLSVICAAQKLSYRELNSRANQLSHLLVELGVGPDSLIGICMERSIEMVIAVLAILKAGGAYLPLDPGYPKERLDFMLQDATVGVILTQQRLLGRLPEFSGVLFCLDEDPDFIATQSDKNLAPRENSENLAYVIYTSGSTGTPKGVSIPHRALVNNIYAVAEHYAMGSTDRRSQFASISFDVFAAELFTPLVVGACVVLGPDPWFASFADFSRFVDEAQLTVMSLPTAIWHEWVTLLDRSEVQLPATLRLVIVGTEQALADRFNIWQRLAGKRPRWCNAYGPTEATITTTIFDANANDCELQTVPIGRPIANTQVYLLDLHLNPVPIGVPGELYIGGSGLARGYLHRPDLTAERFVPNPFAGEAGHRLYKTGDLGRYREDGNIEFLGRMDDQVKIRGYRIEIGEVEAVLSQHPAVHAVAVLVREEQPGEKRLVAYVAADREALAISELRGFSRKKLPEHMVPAVFVILQQLPINPNGKIDRHLLSSLVYQEAESPGTFVAPRTAVERELVAIWAEVFGLEEVGVRDDFFDLGGHSLTAIRVINRIRDRLLVELPVRTVFDKPTIEDLALEITQV
ncbi:MAG: amino acid adenylation domain-containing protein [Candidatus Binatia bacterium]